ncbi:MAG: hypothetical protein A4E35_00086 [Methanoregula sp. PtaU1.Bin051]|nr:MAG: hypothetical protein A4E35_00086 [Methanoregula sp. PtaU1.Bin051]
MKYPGIVPVIILVALVLAAGCTIFGDKTTPAPTPVPTEAPVTEEVTTAVPTTSAGSLVPGPTETIPSTEAISVSVEKGGTYSTTIITSFNGGKGLNFVSRIEVKVTRPDGSVVTGILKPIMGDTLELEGTTGSDRIEVTAVMKSGKIYKIIDQLVPYKTRS